MVYLKQPIIAIWEYCHVGLLLLHLQILQKEWETNISMWILFSGHLQIPSDCFAICCFIPEVRGRDIGRGRSRLLAESSMWDTIPGPQNHALSQSQMFNCWATQASPLVVFFEVQKFLIWWRTIYHFFVDVLFYFCN